MSSSAVLIAGATDMLGAKNAHALLVKEAVTVRILEGQLHAIDNGHYPSIRSLSVRQFLQKIGSQEKA